MIEARESRVLMRVVDSMLGNQIWATARRIVHKNRKESSVLRMGMDIIYIPLHELHKGESSQHLPAPYMASAPASKRHKVRGAKTGDHLTAPKQPYTLLGETFGSRSTRLIARVGSKGTNQ